MAGNQPNQGYVVRDQVPHRYVPGEKPVLNEKWEILEDSSLGEIKQRQDKEPPPVKTEKAEEAVSGENRFKKGMRLFHTKRWEDALGELLLVEAGDLSGEERTELAYYRGLCHTKLERFDEALQYFEQVITAADNPVQVFQCRMILAYIYIMTGRAQMAEDELNRLQTGGLESAMLFNAMAYSAYVQKHYLEAIELYEKSLDIDKDNATAMNSLGYVLADTGLDKLRGLRLCRKAVEKNPENAAYLDSVGWASYKCGNLKDARSWLRRAIDIAPQEAEIKEHFRIVTRGAV